MVALNMKYGDRLYRVADYSHVGMINGTMGVGKSTLLEPIMESALTGETVKGWLANIEGRVIYIDTEQPKDIAAFQDARILKNVKNPERFSHEIIVDKVSSKDKQDRIFEILKDGDDIGLCITDNLSAVVTDINDQFAAGRFKERINAFAHKHNILFIFASHVNTSGTAKGAIGSNISAISSFTFTLELYKSVGMTVVRSDKSRYGFVPDTEFEVDFKTKEVIPGIYQPYPSITS